MRNRVVLADIEFDAISTQKVTDKIVDEAARGLGGRLTTPNLHTLSLIRGGEVAASWLNKHDLVLCDGMPLIWFAPKKNECRLVRVTGADLLPEVLRSVRTQGISVFLIGGPTNAAERIKTHFVGLNIVGATNGRYDVHPTEHQVDYISDQLLETKPGIVVVSLGFPKQELLSEALYHVYPHAWYLNTGMALSFILGEQSRAPRLLQRFGFEWAWRLVHEPRRLFSRYIMQDMPSLVWLFAAKFRRAHG